MFIFFLNKSKNSKGFTLVEILIVMAIIGSIIGFILPKLGDNQQKAKQKEAKIQIGVISNALATYNLDCNKYPASLDGLVKQDDCTNWGPNPYYTKKLKDPWGNDLHYEISGNDFILKSYGKDGKEGGSGFGKDISFEDESGAEANKQ